TGRRQRILRRTRPSFAPGGVAVGESSPMYFVGVDLAWGDRRPTGLAVLDGEGRLVHVSTVITDDEIVATLTPYTDTECLVAIDAPLIVTNPDGNRAAEAALNKEFAPFDAGAH